MSKLFEVKIHYQPADGSFMRLTPSGSSMGQYWQSCRESFQYTIFHSAKKKPAEIGSKFQFLFFAGAGSSQWSQPKKDKSENVIKFMTRLQDEMELPNRNRCMVLRTTNPMVLLIRPSRFWSHPMRTSFLTAALRRGMFYDGNFKEALYGRRYRGWGYFSISRKATKKFLAGETAWGRKKFTGWVKEFHDISGRTTKENLLKQK